MSTTIKRVEFGSSAWVPRGGDTGILRAAMVLKITVAGFDAHDLVPDLAHYIADHLSWATIFETVVPLDSAPLGVVDLEALAARVGALIVTLDSNQGAPTYGEDSYLAEPDEANVRISIEQVVSPEDADRAMLIARRRELVALLAPVSGTIP